MRIQTCDECGARFDISRFEAGKKLRCGRCKKILVVEAEAPESTIEEAKSPAGSPVVARARPTRVTRRARAKSHARVAEKEAPAKEAVGKRAVSDRLATRRLRREEEAAPRSKKKAAVILSLCAAGLLLVTVVALIVASGPGTGTGEAGARSPLEQEYEQQKKRYSGDPDQHYRLALWCKEKNWAEKVEYHLLLEARRLDPHDDALELLRQLAAEKISALPSGALEAHLELMNWCRDATLEEEGEEVAEEIVDNIDPDNAEAHEFLGHEKYHEEWIPKEEAEALREEEERQKWLASLPPRERKLRTEVLPLIAQQVRGWDPENESHFNLEPSELPEGEDDYSRRSKKNNRHYFTWVDDPPYLVCFQNSDSYAERMMIEMVLEALQTVFDHFHENYAGLYDLEDMKDEIVQVWVYETSEQYHKCGGPENAAAHFEPSTGRLKLHKSLLDEGQSFYETTIHEETHQLLHFAQNSKRAGPRDLLFWFNEGHAQFFEVVGRDPSSGTLAITETLNPDRLPPIKSYIKTKQYVPFEEMLDYGHDDYWREQNDPRTSKIDKNHRSSVVYAQSWSMVYFLYNYEPDDDLVGKYQRRFQDYFREELRGRGGLEAFKRALGVDIEQLEEEWKQFMLNERIPAD